VPSDCPTETARQIVSAKRLWIYTKLAQRERLARPLAAREFVTGEDFAYLGRTYRLKLVDSSDIGGAPAGGASTCTGAVFSSRRAISTTSWLTNSCTCVSRATTNGSGQR
jgi:hypothetical protein